MRYRVTVDQTVRAVFYIEADTHLEARKRVLDGDWGSDDPEADETDYNQLSEDVVAWRVRSVDPVEGSVTEL